AARAYADRNRLAPGSEGFNRAREASADALVTNGGARQLENSDMWHAEGMYNFKNQIRFLDLIVGGHFRKYDLESQRTLFPLRADNSEYTVQEYGAYAQLARTFSFSENFSIRPTFASRYDKNEYLEGGFTPRGSVVVTAKEHNLRASYQMAFRNPSPGNLFAFNLNPTGLSELGGTELIAERANLYANPAYTEGSVLRYRETGDPNVLVQYAPQIIQTEKIAAWEVGYKSRLFDRLFVDAYYFRSNYSDFIANQNYIQPRNGRPAELLEPQTSTRYQINLNKADETLVEGMGVGVEYGLPRSFKLSANYAYQVGRNGDGVKLAEPDAYRVGRSFFNSPENRANVTLGNGRIAKNTGFSLTWRWQDRTWWEQGFSGDAWVPAFQTVDAQVSYRLTALKSVVKLGGSNLFNHYYAQGYGLPRVGGLYYLSVTFDELMR
ncbi:MAG: TonB-dependent receptor, partial [Ferruginibacter sp.]|nr:TonB-dependent receptor [Cytophagales bacterium]